MPSQFDWRYELEREVGKGATSTVWLAIDRRSDARVALKLARTPQERACLADEGERLAVAQSPSLPRLFGTGVSPSSGPLPGVPFLALEWIDGRALDPRAIADDDRGQLALQIARDVAEALSELHEIGLSHGDIKPDNIVLERKQGDKDWRAVLVDLGLSGDATATTVQGGTLRYLPPEVKNASLSGDGRARDLWALGLTIAEVASRHVAESDRPRDVARDARFPEEVQPLIAALLATVPAARASADWVRRVAGYALGIVESHSAEAARRRRRVERTYLAARRSSLLSVARGRAARIAVEGVAANWLERVLGPLGQVSVLRGATTDADPIVLSNLDVLERDQWLSSLIGSQVASWPSLPPTPDSVLAERLIALCEHLDPQAITYADLSSLERVQWAKKEIATDPVSIALELARPGAHPSAVDAAERLVLTAQAPPGFVVALGKTLRRRGELARALVVLGTLSTDESRVEAAEAARYAGDGERALALLDRIDTAGLEPLPASRAAACRARIAFDGRHFDEARRLLDAAPQSAETCVVGALVNMAEMKYAAARALVHRGLSLSTEEAERARLHSVAGNIAHAVAESRAALDAFRNAVEHAVRAGAVLEEATYLTGLAATAFDAGHLGEALGAARRAALLFEHLGRPVEAARALVTIAAVYANVGSVALAREAADAAIFRARQGNDQRCRAFAHFPLADGLPMDDAEGLEHARRAAALLERSSRDDRLRAAARRLARSDPEITGDIGAFDSLARSADVPSSARLDWWCARAERALSERTPNRADAIVAELSALSAVPAPVLARARAFGMAAQLAARLGDGEAARRFTVVCSEAARILVDGAPPELRAAVSSASWALPMRTPRDDSLTEEQIVDIETLVHALGSRDRLRPLLDQVLDALVLWTGVERGLLLLRAPGEKLVPRAARNLARADLSGAQLALSRTLAERALQTREPVVAVDAAGELPEVHVSVHALQLRSVLAVPLLAKGEAVGVVYLDDRVRRGAFGPRELSWVRLVASLAGVAIADARDQILLRRAARRARRAESRLESALARREAELDVAQRELARTRELEETRFRYDAIVGRSEPVRAMLRLVDRVTSSEIPVLITGESGSGKELIARAIHENGPRASHAFVSENCAAIPEGLLESTLFGHVRGAFTGAARPRAGLFEIAHRGTLFLDEIGEMSLAMQTKLLRVLEDGELRPVGSERARRVDVRVIAATHRDLAAMTEEGKFRRDLFYRLNVIAIRVPPLRERAGDVAVLARHFIEKYARERPIRVSKAAFELLSGYEWPGNIRQLENEIRRAIVLADDVILPEHLSREVVEAQTAEGHDPNGLNLRTRIDSLEAELVKAALARTDGNQTRAAELLGLSRFGLQKMMKRLNIAADASVAGRGRSGELTRD